MNSADGFGPASNTTANSPQARDFVEAVHPMLPAYRVGVFSYVAVTHGGEKVILRARLELSCEEPLSLKHSLSTETFGRAKSASASASASAQARLTPVCGASRQAAGCLPLGSISSSSCLGLPCNIPMAIHGTARPHASFPLPLAGRTTRSPSAESAGIRSSTRVHARSRENCTIAASTHLMS